MADSIRQQIFSAVLTRLRGIKTTQAYETNLGDQLHEWRDLASVPLTEGELDAGAVRDRKETSEHKYLGAGANNRHEKALEIEVEVATSTANPNVPGQVRRMIADIEKAIGVDRKWSNLALDTSPVSVTQMDVQHAGRVIGGAKITFTIRYQQRAYDPYTQ